MQIHNFYTDPFPSVRNPLDSIVLSPHTIKANDFSLVEMQEDSSDYQSFLPSICSCKYHDLDTCPQSKWFRNCVQDLFCRVFKSKG